MFAKNKSDIMEVTEGFQKRETDQWHIKCYRYAKRGGAGKRLLYTPGTMGRTGPRIFIMLKS